MFIKMKGTVSGSRDGQPWPPSGGVMEVSDEEGRALCEADMATQADGPDPEATEPPVEKRPAPSDGVETREDAKPSTRRTQQKS